MATPYREKIKRLPRQTPLLPFLLPLPLVITILFSLAQHRFLPFAASLAGMASYLLAGYFLSRANYYQGQAEKRKWERPSRTPWRLSAAIFTAIGTSVVAFFAAQSGLLISLGYGLVAFFGLIFYYGLDPSYKDAGASLSGVTSEELSDAFNEAETRIASIRTAAQTIRRDDAGLADRIEHIAKGSEGILQIIDDDPKDLRRARKFLKVYLDGAQQVINKYVKRTHLQDDKTIESNLRAVLDSIDTVIEEQRIKLQEDDILELDVQIEVLQTQLKHEGIS